MRALQSGSKAVAATVVDVLLGYSTVTIIFNPPVFIPVNVEVAGVEVETGTGGVRNVDNTTVGNTVIIGSAEITPPVSIVRVIVVVGAIRVCSFSLKRKDFEAELNRFMLGPCSDYFVRRLMKSFRPYVIITLVISLRWPIRATHFCTEIRMFCVEIELLGRNVTLFRGKTHMFRRNTAVLGRNMHLLRRHTAVLRRNMRQLRRNTAVLHGNMRLLRRNTKFIRLSKFARKYSNSAKFLRAIRPDYDIGVWTHLNLIKEITSSKLIRLWL